MDDYDHAEALASRFQDRLAVGRGVGGRGGRGRGGGGGGGRHRPSQGAAAGDRTVQVSKALSKLLRHRAGLAGIPMDAEGYAPLDQVLRWGPIQSLGVTVAEVRAVVETNEKQRFALRPRSLSPDERSEDPNTGERSEDPKKERSEDTKKEQSENPQKEQSENPTEEASGWEIRANQGHSIPLASDGGLLTPIADAATAPAVVCHGTFLAFWPQIEAAGGLRPMSRNHVHFGCLAGSPADEAGDEPAAAVAAAAAAVEASARNPRTSVTIPGLRKTAQVLVYVDVRRALREAPESLRWWRSANGVVLSEGGVFGGGGGKEKETKEATSGGDGGEKKEATSKGDGQGEQTLPVVPTRFFQKVVTTDAAKSQLLAAGVAMQDLPLTLWQDGQRVGEVPAAALARARPPPNQRGVVRRAHEKEKRGGKA